MDLFLERRNYGASRDLNERRRIALIRARHAHCIDYKACEMLHVHWADHTQHKGQVTEAGRITPQWMLDVASSDPTDASWYNTATTSPRLVNLPVAGLVIHKNCRLVLSIPVVYTI